jgi:hypothetical protein
MRGSPKGCWTYQVHAEEALNRRHVLFDKIAQVLPIRGATTCIWLI